MPKNPQKLWVTQHSCWCRAIFSFFLSFAERPILTLEQKPIYRRVGVDPPIATRPVSRSYDQNCGRKLRSCVFARAFLAAARPISTLEKKQRYQNERLDEPVAMRPVPRSCDQNCGRKLRSFVFADFCVNLLKNAQNWPKTPKKLIIRYQLIIT